MIRFIASFSLLLLASTTALAKPDVAAVYADKCSSCHAATRLGGTGPALIPESLSSLRGDAVKTVISKGRTATQMPAFEEILPQDQIEALAKFVTTPLAQVPSWQQAGIEATRVLNTGYKPVSQPAFKADPLNITLVVETGDHHVSVLDGDSFAVLDRFATPFAVHGGPKFTPEGRYVFIMSRDGWVQKYDIWSLKEVGQSVPDLTAATLPSAMMASGWPLPTTCHAPLPPVHARPFRRQGH